MFLVLPKNFDFIRNFAKNNKGEKMKRLIFTYVCFCLMFLLAIGRCFYIVNNKTFTANVNNSKKQVDFGFSRGAIFDCNKVKLTNAEDEYFVAVAPNSQNANAVKDYLDEEGRKTLSMGFPIKIKVDEKFENNNVIKLKIPKRYSGIASHIIGYCDSEGNGICGVEQSFNDILKGQKISVSFNTDVNGKIIANKQEITNNTELQQKGVMLTIDKSIQDICETTAKEHLKKGAIVVLENKTGKIKALVSTPTYNPNNISASLDSNASPFFNRALAAYNCGSVFKILVAAAALYYDINLTYFCNGNLTIGDTTFGCIQKHNFTTMKKAIALSCNCYFIKLGQKIGAKRLLSFAKSFGFGNEISLMNSLVSTGANLPDEQTLTNIPADLANFSFGQGVLLTSPLHIASMIACVANDGKYISPTLVEGITNNKGEILKKFKQQLPTYLLTKDDATTLQKYLVNAVEKGTGKAAKPTFTGAGGKTATAQTGIYEKNGKAVYQTWFGGFYPDENPVYTIVVLCENGNSGSKSAAPVFKKIADGIYGIR